MLFRSLTVTSDDTGEATVNSPLTFTSANWDTPQTVTVTGIDDDIIDGTITSTITVAVDDANSDDNFDSLADQTVSATTTDDDVAGFTIVETDGSTEVDESGTTDTFTVVLDAEPTEDVVLSVTSGDETEATVNPGSITFTNENWDTPQTITTTGTDDVGIIDGSQISDITVAIVQEASDDNFDSVADQTVSATTTDDDVAGFTIVESDGSTEVDESGTTDTFTIVLDAQPTSDVVLTIASDDTGEATVPASVTFTSADWDTPQTITVTGIDDGTLIDGNQDTMVIVSIDDANSDDGFDSLEDQTVVVTTTDDDIPEFTVTETDGSTEVAESGTTDTFTVVLDAQPQTDVVMDIVSSDSTETLVTSSLTFTTSNWNVPQTATVTGVDDYLIDGTVTSTITVSINVDASNEDFAFTSPKSISSSTTDDDTPGYAAAETDGATIVEEDGFSDAFTIVLTAQPVTDVVFTVTSDDVEEVTVIGSITFTTNNWDTEQTIPVEAFNEYLIDGNQNSTITISVDSQNTDDDFDGLLDTTISVETIDDDKAGFTIIQTGGDTVISEDGTTDTFSIVLTAQPTSDVEITLSQPTDVNSNGNLILNANISDEATISIQSLIFTPENWDTPQAITVNPENDGLIDGDIQFEILAEINDATSDPDFAGVGSEILIGTNLDDDVAGFEITLNDTYVIVNETGTTATFNIVLTAEPLSDVVLLLTSSDTGEATVTGSLTFTPENWDEAQIVTVTGVDDTIIDKEQYPFIIVSISDTDSDVLFADVENQRVGVSNFDDEADRDNDYILDPDDPCPDNPDCDGDGIRDNEEPSELCITDPDCDDDGLLDGEESTECITDPDCDDDGLLDGEEPSELCITDPDCDDDGLLDGEEPTELCITDPDCDDDGILDPDEVAPECITDPDCDDDGLLDGEEPTELCVTDPDCDDDGLLDGEEPSEMVGYLMMLCVTDPDCDDDGLLDDEEPSELCITDPDCDDDGILDPDEVAPECITDPDCDDDGILDPDEVAPECITDPDLECGKEIQTPTVTIPDLEKPNPTAPETDSPSSPFPWWIVIVAGIALLIAARIFVLRYLGRRSPIITHIAISESDDGYEIRKGPGTETTGELMQDSEIEFLSDAPGQTDIKFAIRLDSGKLKYGMTKQSYTNSEDLQLHVLELDALPEVVSIGGLVSEIIWSIKAKRTLGITFSLEFEIDGKWTEISQITEGQIDSDEDYEIPTYCRVVANSPFKTKRYSNPAPLGAIKLSGASATHAPN